MTDRAEPTPRRSAARRALLALLGLALSAGILALVFDTLELSWSDLLAAWGAADQGLVATAVLCSVAWHVLLGAHKLYLILRAMGANPRYWELARLRLGEGPLRLLLPLRGGELFTVAFFHQHQRMPLGAASGALVFDRSLNLLGTAVWLLTGLLLLPAASPSSARTVTSVALLVGLYLALTLATPLHQALTRLAARLHQRAGNFARGLLSPWRDLSAGRKLLLAGYGVLFSARPPAVCAMMLAAHGLWPGPGPVLAYTALALLAGALPGPILGLGPREGVLALALAAHAPTASAAPLSVALLTTLAVHLLPMALGAPYVPWLLRHLKKTPRDR